MASTLTMVDLLLEMERVNTKDVAANDKEVVLVNAVVIFGIRAERLAFEASVELFELLLRLTAIIKGEHQADTFPN